MREHKSPSVSIRVVVVFLVGLLLATPPGVALSATSSSADPGVFAGQNGGPRSSAGGKQVRLSETYGRLPLYFEVNLGQTDPQVKFISRDADHTLFLTSTEAVLVFTQSERAAKRERHKPRGKFEIPERMSRTAVRMAFLGANPQPRVSALEQLPGKVSYFVGNDPAKWRTGIAISAKVRYEDIYPGIDLIFYRNKRQLEYDFVVRSGADPAAINLVFRGAEKVEVDGQGDLVLTTSAGAFRQRKPAIYQEVKGIRREIFGGYVLKGAYRVGFRVAAYDAGQPLIIDPTLFYSTYLGGSGDDEGRGIAVDADGNAYVTGSTNSADFPTTAGALQPTPGGGSGDAFVTKLDPTGSSLVYSTYLGGTAQDTGLALAVDPGGNAYVTGATSSTDFPTTPGAFQTAYPGGSLDAFVTKLNPTGSLVYSTYLGGSEGAAGYGIAVDALGNAYVTGNGSGDFPTTSGAFQTEGSVFVTKFDPTGASLVYSTLLCCYLDTFAIAVDPAGNAYVTGRVFSQSLPTTPGAFQPNKVGVIDAFVIKLNPTGSALIYCTYLGGTESQEASGIAADAVGNAYVAGRTSSPDFPAMNAAQPTFAGNSDAFVTKLNPIGSALEYSTYLGGSGDDSASGITLDIAGNAYVTGFTTSPDFPTTGGAFQSALSGSLNAFVTKVDASGSALAYSTYLGGSTGAFANGIAVDTLPNPNAYVTGFAGSDFPTTAGAAQSTFGGTEDVFVSKIANVTPLPGRFSARLTGGGTINVTGGIGNFHLIVQKETDGTLHGQLQYFNHASGARVKSDMITSLLITGNMATFSGTCTVDSPCTTFRVDVTDNGQPGTNDKFTITVNLGPPEGGVLRSGNILIQQ